MRLRTGNQHAGLAGWQHLVGQDQHPVVAGVHHTHRQDVAGARVLELFQIGVVQGNVTVGVGVLSYAGQLNFDILGDADACPDLAVFTAGLRDALQELGVGMLMPRASGPPPVSTAAS